MSEIVKYKQLHEGVIRYEDGTCAIDIPLSVLPKETLESRAR